MAPTCSTPCAATNIPAPHNRMFMDVRAAESTARCFPGPGGVKAGVHDVYPTIVRRQVYSGANTSGFATGPSPSPELNKMARNGVAAAERSGDELNHSDLVARTYGQLRNLIVLGRLSPGSRIIESDLADRLGVSRTPVRSALQRLQQEGFVLGLAGGRNARLAVSPLTADDGRDLLNLLGALESVAVRTAALLPERQRKGLVADLERINNAFGELVVEDSPDPESIFRTHSSFHQAHIEAVGGARIQALYGSTRPQAERYRRVYITSAPHALRGEVEEHVRIIEAVAKGDAEAAQLAVLANWANAADRLGALIDRLGDRGNW